MGTRSYDAFLQEQLRDPELAAEYLTAAIEEDSPELFLIALRNVLLDPSTEPTKTTPRLTLKCLYSGAAIWHTRGAVNKRQRRCHLAAPGQVHGQASRHRNPCRSGAAL